ncbi:MULTISPECIES: hypothetical protein [Thiorhodovibrio]|uniref:hypothetical protein n=1 Tax=Thiorhodovibrio TaxID=61593 RepID=UPI0019125D0E|nr:MULTISPECIES: hypothetical protein [Thiorhodovibrio]MBK5969140.1 hypothetical protein [Thiorhodovibrio winogradskyi]WPL13387.1 hypothetical protein Thiosp_03188 [Thiorhodovibrio litoralis]
MLCESRPCSPRAHVVWPSKQDADPDDAAVRSKLLLREDAFRAATAGGVADLAELAQVRAPAERAPAEC